MFGFGSKGFDKKQWLADQALVASKEQTLKQLRKLTGEREKIEERVKIGELTRAAFNAVDDKINVVRERLHRIGKLEVEMPGRCPDKKLKQQMQQLRRRFSEELRRQTELGHALEEVEQRANRLQRQYDESSQDWPAHERERMSVDLERVKADVEYAASERQKQRQLVADIKAEKVALSQKMLLAKA